jgi:acyl-CoA thioesterase
VLRHEVEPGRVITALAVLCAAVLYGGDAAGRWHIPWFVGVPVVFGGHVVASAVAGVVQRLRAARLRQSASAENTGAPATISGSQAIR